MKRRVNAGAGRRERSLSSSAFNSRTEIFVAEEISSSVISRTSLSRRSSSPNRRTVPWVISISPRVGIEQEMLIPLAPARKKSFGASLHQPGNAGGLPDPGQIGRARPGQKRERHGTGKGRVSKEGASEGRPLTPPVV